MKRWNVNGCEKSNIADLARRCDLGPLALKVLCSRGFDTLDKLSAFFGEEAVADPFEIRDMHEAADAVNEAIDSGSLICVYGDYDCDGITATAILYSFLESMGASVMYHIPERSEGYGMSISAVEKLADLGVELIVTVDNGISAIAEAERIYELGMKLVVTDHHRPLDVYPKAEAVVDPHREDCPSKYKDLAGAGVALKLCIALNDGDAEPILEQYADICALGTVADIVTLTGENRTIVKAGLAGMKNTENLGLGCLMDAASCDREKMTSSDISFRLAPRINASGRFGSPLTAVKALLADDEDDAESCVETMVTLNEQRRTAEASIYDAVLAYLDLNPALLCRRVLILSGKNWHHGVIGIVAARLLERFGKPTILLSIDEAGVARGSARSVKGFDIFKCLCYADGEDNLLDHFGGHECAGGLTVAADKIKEFAERVYKFAADFELMPTAVVECDTELDPADLTVENVRDLERLEPFGAGNPRPVFALTGARVTALTPLSGGKHTRLELSCGGRQLSAVMFGCDPSSLPVTVGSSADLAVLLDINTYNGRESVNIKVTELRPHGLDQERYFNALDCYEKYVLGAELPVNYLKHIYPRRSELVEIYKKLAAAGDADLDGLYAAAGSRTVNYAKLRIAVDAFVQMGLAEYRPSTGKVRLLPVTEKVDIESAEVLRKLRERIGSGDADEK
ncbi:MAG: single-stranded-DNA-specific exonuclease RecJ [Ruminococcus sp.]|nr:single-stranded-DNA-specific exonuclease RecJ [Ruminococcus sp.]